MTRSVFGGNRLDEQVDVLIVGAGVIGSAIAAFLKAEVAAPKRILLVERDPLFREGSTGLSVGGFRRQFSVPENIAMAAFSIDFLKRAGETLTVDGTTPDLGVVTNGYLFLVTPDKLPLARTNHARQIAMGAPIDFLERPVLEKRFPWLHCEDLAAGTIGSDEGWLDPHSLRSAFLARAKRKGVALVADEVVAIRREGQRINGVQLASGKRIGCGALVNAAGPRAARLAALAGIDLPVSSRKRIVHFVKVPDAPEHCPLIVDPTGVYVRPEGAGFLCGTSPPEDQDVPCDDFDLGEDRFDADIWPVLARRIPAFEQLRRIRSWAGHYAVNTADHNAILGPHPTVSNFFFANGFSGHGLQQSPAVGCALAEWICRGRSETLALDRFGYERVIAGRPLREQNVI